MNPLRNTEKMGRVSLLILIASFLLNCSHSEIPNSIEDSLPSTPTSTSTSIGEVVVPNIPKSTWEPIFYEAIDERTKSARMGRLRDRPIKDADIELRLWGGFGVTTLDGFLLSRTNDQWKALHLYSEWDGKKMIDRTTEIKEPSSGWQTVWNSLLAHRLLTLPDGDSIDCNPGMNDGFSYVVEVKKGANYRTYMYENPSVKGKNLCKEADEILAISKIITTEFGLP